ncbi:MAG: Uma2 family endonuclease [Hyphomicrobiales bacterium]
MNAPPKIRMKVEQFLAWGETQTAGRYELVEGEIVMMSPERARHNRAKYAITRALDDAVAAAGLNYTVYTDGMGVRINDDTVREPDATVQEGAEVDGDALLLDRPVIVVEVISPSSHRSDTTDKMIDYFSVASIQHYLVVDAEKRRLIHYGRAAAGSIATQVWAEGKINLAPPGLTIDVSELFGVKKHT